MKITVLGDGAWGTTLAILLSRKGYPVTLWSAFVEHARDLDKTRINKRFLPGIKIPKAIEITSSLDSAILQREIIVLAVPSQYLRAVLKDIKGKKADLSQTICLSVTKGIEIGTLKRMSQVIKEELGNVKLAVLSGPTIAHEVVNQVPTTAVIASFDKRLRKYLQDIFMTPTFRVYTNRDVTGVELGGSLKNVIAIACGISDGLGFGTNTKAAILSRGLSEISRLGLAMGAEVKTFSGITGLGDLVTTCISVHSRNRFVGEQIGRGKSLKAIAALQAGIAEGIPTAKSAYALSLKHKVDMPITKEVYAILYRNKSPFKGVGDLMTREKKEE